MKCSEGATTNYTSLYNILLMTGLVPRSQLAGIYLIIPLPRTCGDGRKEGNVLFNDALNTFYLRLYGVRHMVKDHSDSEKGNPLPPHRLLFPISSKGSLNMHHPTDRIAHTTTFVTPVVEHWLEREIAQWVHPMKDRSDDPSHHERTLLPRSYISLHAGTVSYATFVTRLILHYP